jgi:hypothetical protein
MKSNTRRVGVAALTLIVCLAISPWATAAPVGDPPVRDKVVKFLKKLKKIAGVITLEDLPSPPRP